MFCLWYFIIIVFYCLYFGFYLWIDNVYDRLNYVVIVFKMLKKICLFDYLYFVVIVIFFVCFRNFFWLVKIVILMVMLIYLFIVMLYFMVLMLEEMMVYCWFGVVSFFLCFCYILCNYLFKLWVFVLFFFWSFNWW